MFVLLFMIGASRKGFNYDPNHYGNKSFPGLVCLFQNEDVSKIQPNDIAGYW